MFVKKSSSQPFFLLTLWIGFLFFSQKIQADTFIIKEWQAIYHLSPYTEIADIEIADISLENINQQLAQAPFQPLGQQDFPLVANRYYWGKITLQNNLPNAARYKEWILDMSYSLTEYEVYIQTPDGEFQHQLNGIFRPHQFKDFVPKIEGSFTRIILPPQQSITIYFRGKSNRASIQPNFRLRLQHITSFYERLQTEKRNHAFFIGFIVMMLLYNVILYFFGRDKSFIFYSIYLLTLIIYASYSSGDLADWLEPTFYPNHPEYSYLGKLVIYIGLMAYIAFMRNFLKLNELLPKWDVFFNGLFWIGLPWMVVDFIIIIQSGFSYVDADPITFGYILLFFFSNLIFIYFLFKTKDKKAYFIIAGILVWFGGAILSLISWLQTPAFNLIYLKIGSILEIIAFSLGLAYRQRENVKAKQKAYFELEKSKILQEQEQAEAQRLKELDELKSNLYTNITHEFRTPLTVIMGMNENIKGHEQERKLIRRNSKNLLQLISQLLDLSKVESANLELHKIKGDIINYLHYLTESFQSMATDKGIQLVFYAELDSQIMDYDEIKIQHIIYNLLSNALKFTEERGKVIVHIQKIGKENSPQLKIKISDTGIGIPTDLIPHIFDRFYQVDNTLTRKGEGTGIGLALVKELVTLMEGSIEVQSEDGKGSQFIICLPIVDELSTTNLAPLHTLNKAKLEEAIIEANRENITEIATTFNTSTDEEQPILLIIEDNRDVTSYIQSILKKDYTIHTAINGEVGIEQAIAVLPDIIISDVMMPVKNGYEVCETLKGDERTSHIPIILLTAKAEQTDKLTGLKYGADAYLTKPFDKEELLLRLENLVLLRKKLQARFNNPEISSSISPIEQQQADFIKKLESIVLEQLSNAAFSIPQLAQSCGMSQTQVYRKLKALTDKTPSQFIRSIRLKEGKKLLENSDLNISEIAYEVGFTDPNYFSRTFQQAFGISPRDYRK